MRLFSIGLLIRSRRVGGPASASLDHAGSSMNNRRDSGRNELAFSAARHSSADRQAVLELLMLHTVILPSSTEET